MSFLAKFWLIVLALATAATVTLLGSSGSVLCFVPDAGQRALDTLGVLLIVTLFIERAQEVIMKSWRSEGRVPLTEAAAAARAQLDRLQADGASQVDLRAAQNGYEAASGALELYRSQTRRFALLLGITIGVLVALSGLRLLEDIVLEPPSHWLQRFVFVFVDIVIVAGLIGGGSDALHKLIALVTDFLDTSRKKAVGT